MKILYWCKTGLIPTAALLVVLALFSFSTPQRVGAVDGTISGVVTDAVTGLPIANMAVYDSYNNGYSTCTDANGQYTLTGLPLDTEIKLRFGSSLNPCPGQPAGYLYEYLGHGWNQNDGTPITLTVVEPDATDVDFAMSAGGSISGTVTDGDTGLPIANMTISFNWDGGYGPQEGAFCTDANGEYTVDGLPLNLPYRIMVNGDNNYCVGGPTNYVREYHGDTINWGSVVFVTPTNANPDLTGVDLTPEVGGTVSGLVLDAATNQPVSWIRLNINTDIGWLGACTDYDGTYSVNIPFDVEVQVDVSPYDNFCGSSDMPYAQEWWQDANGWDTASSFTVTQANPNQTGINFMLDPGGTIAGVVTVQGSGLPIAGVQVTAEWNNNGRTVCTDANGAYLIAGLSLDVPLRIHSGSANGGCTVQTYIQEFWEESSDGNFYDAVTLTSGSPDATGIDFTLEPGGTIAGTVTDQGTGLPIPNVNVSVNWNGGSFGTCTDTNGDYTLYGVPLNIPVTVNKPSGDNWCGGVQDYVFEAWQNSPTWNGATLITLTAGSPSMSDVDLSPELGGTVSGVVTDEDTGLPIANINVNVNWQDNGRGVCTDTNGDYAASGIPLDVPVRVSVAEGNNFCGGAQNYVPEFWQETQNWGEATILTLTLANPSIANINLTPRVGGTVEGTVTDEDTGLPIANINVNVNWQDNGRGVCTDANGDYAASGIPLDVPVRVSVAEGDNFCGGTQNYVWEYWQETHNWGEATILTLTLANPTLANINLTPEVGGTIDGTVTDQTTGLPIPNVNVNANWDSSGTGTCTDANGQYHLTDVPLDQPLRVSTAGGDNWCGGAQNYREEFWEDTPWWDSATVLTLTTASSSLTDIDLSPEVGGVIRGIVTDEESGDPLPNVVVSLNWGNHGTGTCTDANGQYVANDVPFDTPTRVFVAAGDNWCGGSIDYVQEYWDNTFFWDEATLVTVTAATPEMNDINLSPAIGGKITGTLYNADESAVITSNAWVDVSDYNTGMYIMGTGVRPDGTYEFVLPPGEYILSAAGVDLAMEYYSEAGAVLPDATPVTVTLLNTTSDIDFTLGVGGTISGTVFAEDGVTPLANMSIGLVEGWIGGCTDNLGNYTMYNIPLDTPYHVWTGGPGNGCGGSTNYIEEWWNGSYGQNGSQTITLTSIQPDLIAINFTLELGGSISGVVRAAEDNSPLANVWLCAFDFAAPAFNLGHNWACTQTQPDGTYTITGVVPGNKRVWIFPEDRLRLFYNGSGSFDGATPVSVSAEATTSNIDFLLPLSGIISGTVYEEDGVTPLANVTISTENGEYMECSQGDGTYRLWVPAGNLTIKAGAGVCNSTVTFPTQYYQASETAAGATPVSVSVGVTTSGINFTRGNVTAPAAPVLTAPTGTGYDDTPVYTWNEVSAAANYRVYVQNASATVVLDQSFSAVAVCTAGVCSVESPSALAPNTYTFWVQAINSGGNAWSNQLDFTVAIQPPAAPVVTAPTGVITTSQPAYGWNEASGATAYRLFVSDAYGATVLDVTYNDLLTLCSSGACSVTPGTTLTDGYYSVWVQALNAGGGTWSNAQNFTVSSVTPPAAPVLTAPAAGTSDTTPAYGWNAVSGATSYRVYVQSISTSAVVVDTTVTSSVCSGGACSLEPAVTLTINESYNLWVQAINVAGSAWSNPLLFTVIPSVPAATTVTAPTGGITDTTPAYVWNEVANATVYRLFVQSYEGVVMTDQVYTTAACSGGTCAADPGVELSLGMSYNAWVLTGNAGGNGPWSAASSFYITTGAPAAPVQIAPLGAGTSTQPTYQWNESAGATQYRLYVNDVYGTLITNELLTSSICTGGVCSYTPSPTLTNGTSYTWWVLAANNGGGAWSNSATFSVGSAPGGVTITAPASPTTNTQPTYEWTEASGATAYRLYVNTVGGTVVIDQVFPSSNCTASVCSVTPAVTLASSEAYQVWVLSSNSSGNGPWSGPYNFSVIP